MTPTPSDLDTLKAMLDRAGVPFTQKGEEITIMVDTPKVASIDGYLDFRTTWVFDEAGALIRVEVWE